MGCCFCASFYFLENLDRVEGSGGIIQKQEICTTEDLGILHSSLYLKQTVELSLVVVVRATRAESLLGRSLGGQSSSGHKLESPLNRPMADYVVLEG